MSNYYEKTLTILLLMFGFQSITAQVNQQIAGDNTIKIDKKVKILKINTSGYSLDFLGELKDELIVWKEKVISISIDEKNSEMKIIHNLYMDEREFFEVLKKYNIKKSTIISYQ